MGLDFYFVYEAEDSAFEVRPVACRGLQGLFEYPKYFQELKNTVIDPEFARDFQKTDDSDEDFNIGEMTEEDWEAVLEPYVGPTFEPQEVVAWAGAWISIIKEVDDRGKVALQIKSTDGYDWTPQVLEDLQKIVAQGEYAHHHGVKMHIEMY